jgi:lipopolysaccharide/colanic/teichoic acid biosynthesis glycosyltransferase
MTSSGPALSGDASRDREEPHLAVAGRETSHHGPIRVPRGPYVRIVKPLFDRVVGFCIFLVLLPLTAVVALAVRISLGSPVIFRQRRVGRDGRPFDVYKFRTMAHDRRQQQEPVDQDRRQTHKTTDDPRHTRVGRCLRKWSLDELPQFWNVVCGDMSLVGPRPELVEIVARYEPWQHQRHAVKPGLTGLWQVSSRGTGMMHLHTDIDLEYIETMSSSTDLKILFRTIPATLARRGN